MGGRGERGVQAPRDNKLSRLALRHAGSRDRGGSPGAGSSRGPVGIAGRHARAQPGASREKERERAERRIVTLKAKLLSGTPQYKILVWHVMCRKKEA